MLHQLKGRPYSLFQGIIIPVIFCTYNYMDISNGGESWCHSWYRGRVETLDTNI